MCLAGMNVARLNFSHGSHEEHQKKIDLIRQVREKLELPIAIMLDTKGPEYRIKTFANKRITLHDGDMFTFTTDDVVGDQTRVSVIYKGLIEDLEVGDTSWSTTAWSFSGWSSWRAAMPGAGSWQGAICLTGRV